MNVLKVMDKSSTIPLKKRHIQLKGDVQATTTSSTCPKPFKAVTEGMFFFLFDVLLALPVVKTVEDDAMDSERDSSAFLLLRGGFKVGDCNGVAKSCAQTYISTILEGGATPLRVATAKVPFRKSNIPHLASRKSKLFFSLLLSMLIFLFLVSR